jgi:uncharacterized YigZ family protein
LDINQPYLVPSQQGSSLYKDKGSKFEAIAFRIPDVDGFQSELARIKAQHPGARHFCYAWRLDPLQNAFRSNDDGEPSGSAGTPIYNAIQSSGKYEVAVVVVRYFGGTKLGVPGLIKAYREAAAEALKDSGETEVCYRKTFKLQIPYDKLGIVEYAIGQSVGEVLEKYFEADCKFHVAIPVAHAETFLQHLPLDIRIFEIESHKKIMPE